MINLVVRESRKDVNRDTEFTYQSHYLWEVNPKNYKIYYRDNKYLISSYIPQNPYRSKELQDSIDRRVFYSIGMIHTLGLTHKTKFENIKKKDDKIEIRIEKRYRYVF